VAHNSKLALVTGGNRGIGLAIANSLKDAGYQVVIGHRSGATPGGFEGVTLDVSSTESVDAAISEIESKYGAVDVLVANAGITKDGLVMRMSDEDFQEVINTNLTGTFRVARACSKGMLKKRSGKIIFIGSVVGLLGSAGQVNYSSSKSGLVGMARSFARELGSRNITANVVAPGFVETDMTAVLNEDKQSEIRKNIPLGRFCTAEEIAEVVAFLASDSANYITGAVIPVDGGLGMGH
jgi:3-oxoacyl-[acyl-carrier protein] reductase